MENKVVGNVKTIYRFGGIVGSKFDGRIEANKN